jgi:hypothetical protein
VENGLWFVEKEQAPPRLQATDLSFAKIKSGLAQPAFWQQITSAGCYRGRGCAEAATEVWVS